MRRNWMDSTKTARSALKVAAAVAMFCVLGGLGGCDNSLKEQNALLTEENQALREELADRNAALETADGTIHDKDSRIAALQRELDDAKWSADNTQTADPFSGIAGVKGSVGAGEITATVESDVLFASGKSTLRQEAKRSLDEVARILTSKYGGKTIRVTGHTDPDPIKKSGYKSNYHLGFERAFAVRQYLIERGVPARQVYIASFGPDRAKASKQASRRVEIAVVLNE